MRLKKFQTQNANPPTTHFKMGSKRALTGGPWRGTRPSSSPAFLRTTRSAKTNTNQNAITAPTHSEGKPRRTEHTAKKPFRRGIWTGGDRGGGWTEQTEPASEERGTARTSGFPSLHATSLSWPRLKIPVMRWNGMRRGRAGGEASTSAVSLNSTNLTAPPSPVQVQPWECKRTVL